VMQKKMKQKERKEEKKGQGKVVCVISENCNAILTFYSML
jgi:hypothetical protein